MKKEEFRKTTLGMLKHWWFMVEDAKGALGGLRTLWNTSEVCLVFSLQTHHWILTKFKYVCDNKIFVVINVYMLASPMEKPTYWSSILSLRDLGFSSDCILAEDFNTIRFNSEKRGGFFGRDPSRDKMEEIIDEWDLIDVTPQTDKFTRTNKRQGPSHIASHLDRFLVHSHFISTNSTLKSFILPSLISYHKPISLHLRLLHDYGPLPFCFLPLWLGSQDVDCLVASAWNTWIPSTLVFIWK